MKKLLTLICPLLALVILFGGCASKTPSAGMNHERAGELTDELIADIPVLLAYQYDTENLLLTEAVVIATDGLAYQSGALETFRQNRADGADASLTVISDKSSLVISRIVFEGEHGFYLRYQHDPASGKEVEVSARAVSDVAFVETDEIPASDLLVSGLPFTVQTLMPKSYRAQVDLTLLNGDEEIAAISFSDLYRLEEPGA
jgi:hypothetical protein